MDEKLLRDICKKYQKIITIEDGIKKGGFGSAILEFISENKYDNKVEVLGIEDSFTEHGSIEELQKINGIDSASIREKIKSLQ